MGLDIRSGLSPALERKVTYSATHATSFDQASRDLAELIEVKIGVRRVARVAHRVGGALVAQRTQAALDYQKLPLLEKGRSPRTDPPNLAVVMVDGGRYQQRDWSNGDNGVADNSADDPRSLDDPMDLKPSKGHWHEDKVGLLTTMSSATQSCDPHPEIPEVFVTRTSAEKLAREVGHYSGGSETPAAPDPAAAADAAATLAGASLDRYEPPIVLARTYVATAKPVRWFEKLLIDAAWQRGFFKAKRRAFVGDGAPMNWTLWTREFRTFEPILDFIHALSYVFAAAMAGRNDREGWMVYCRWINWVWQGKVVDVVAEMANRQAELGIPTADESPQSARSRVTRGLQYLQTHQSRMAYDRYRQLGLPISSCHIESTIKRFNKRIKGTEKFWTPEGAEALLHLKAAYLGELGEIEQFWENRYASLDPKPQPAIAA